MQQLLKLSGVDLEEVIEVLDEVENNSELERLYAVCESLQRQSLESGKTLTQERYAVRPTMNAPF